MQSVFLGAQLVVSVCILYFTRITPILDNAHALYLLAGFSFLNILTGYLYLNFLKPFSRSTASTSPIVGFQPLPAGSGKSDDFSLLFETKEFYQTLINLLNQGIVISDRDFKIVFANAKAVEITGYSMEELKVIDFADILTESSLQTVMPLMEERTRLPVSETTDIKMDIRCKDGRIVPVLISGNMILKEHNVMGTVAVITDLSTIEKTESALQQSEKLYRTLVNQMDEGVVIIDKDLNFNFVNPRILDISGYSEEELIGRSMLDFFGSEAIPVLLNQIEKRKQGKADSYEIDLLKKDGTSIPLFISGKPLLENGEFNGAMAVATDISNFLERNNAILMK